MGGQVIRDFFLTEKQVEEAMQLSSTNGKSTPPPPGVFRPNGVPDEPDEYFYLLVWDAWCHAVPFLKKKIEERSPELYKSNEEQLLKLSFENGELKLFILKPWAAESLGLPETYKFRKLYPFEAYAELICKFH